MNTITIITWTSGVGKSTLKELFAKQYGNQYEVFDFDDVWVPKNADEKWRIDTTQQRIRKLRDLERQWKKSVLFGQLVPDEIASDKDDILFILLEASREELEKRLKERWREDALIATYKWWSAHIKNSVLHQKKWKIVSTMNDFSQAITNILHFISL